MKSGECKYFLAIIPPAEVADRIEKIKKHITNEYHSKGALRSPAHLTLHMPFLWKERNEDRLINKLAQSTKFDSFKLFLNGFGAFPPRTIFMKNEESQALRDFHASLVRFTKRELHLLNTTHNRGFNPHITIAARDLKKDRFEEAWASFKNRPFQTKFTVNGFWLMKKSGDKWQAYKEFRFNMER